ncbi:NAD-P-binding protein [Ramaria rubella]|nr:NAD-P-binding protein [Ramaria rubella]
MASTARRSVFVVAGVGDGSGTGAASARVFAKAGYRVALIARNADHLKRTAEKIHSAGGEATAAAFPIKEYTYEDIHSAFAAIKKHWGDADIRVGLFNAGHDVWKSFLDFTPEEVQQCVNTNIVGGFAFAREAILAFKESPHDATGTRGTLIFTGAIAAMRGDVMGSVVTAGKFSLRALSQTLGKEFGKEDIHVAHAIIGSKILTDLQKDRQGSDWANNEAIRLDPESIAKSYLYLTNQDRSAWTWELDLRPAHEKW